MTAATIATLRAHIAAGNLTGSEDFANNLVAAWNRGRLSAKQEYWVGRLIERAETPRSAPQSETLANDVRGIYAIFDNASTRGLKYPKIHLTTVDAVPVRLYRAGIQSRYPGQIMVVEDVSYRRGAFYGRIDEIGTLYPAAAMTTEVRHLLEAFASDPAGVAAQYGKATGSCCFCGRKLETAESLTVGYGPVCADKYGLPWGAVEQTQAPVAPDADKLMAHGATAEDAAAIRAGLPLEQVYFDRTQADMDRIEAEGDRLSETAGFLSDPDQRYMGGEAAYQRAAQAADNYRRGVTASRFTHRYR